MRFYYVRLKPYLFIFLITQTLLRITLLVRGMMEIHISTLEVVQIFARGLWFDLVTGSFALIPIALALLCIPQSLWHKRLGSLTEGALRFIFIYVLLFDCIAEHLFWSEFSARFNFIAVDYLVYTDEVLKNIIESYPVSLLMTLIGGVAIFTTWCTLYVKTSLVGAPLRQRIKGMGGYTVFCVLLYMTSNASQTQFNDNAEAVELAANGIYNLGYAFWHNEISYDHFYVEHEKPEVWARLRNLLSEKNAPLQDERLNRLIRPPGNEIHKNVIIVCMESMNAAFMGTFGDAQNMTPHLDKLASEGLLFTQLYATGTRTVRGLEAITLSIPPTPGQSIIRRQDNGNLFSLGFLFQDRGYDTKFICGAYGYFDNMNEFFSHNGFDTVDRTTLSSKEIHFANAWGVADEDMFARIIREADKATAAHTPFFYLMMTTSNHRPFSYPEGRIDIPSKSGREGGIKYADYSIGKFMEWAKEKPWYKDTIFIFIADHTAGAGRRAELDPAKYHIPMIFYAPGFIQPGRYEAIASQIDLAPTLLGLLNFHYETKFYGQDLLHASHTGSRAFISTYQKVALVKDGVLTVLSPKRQVTQYMWPSHQPIIEQNIALIDETVAYYQSASWWRETYKSIPATERAP